MSSKGRVSDAVWTAFTEGIRFIVIPIVLVDLISNNYPDLTHAFMPDIGMYILFFGGMITAASTLEAANRPGTFKRLMFGLFALASVCLWLFVILGGGVATFQYGPYFVRFDMSKIVLIMLVGVSLKGLLVVSTYTTHKSYLEEKERQQKAELRAAREQEAARKKLVAKQKASGPSLSRMSKVAFQVTADDSVGYVPEERVAKQTHHVERTLATKTCPVCGAKASAKENVCRSCGAWFEHGAYR